MPTHQDKVAVVSGAANGIGQAFAAHLAALGAAVVIADVADGDETVSLCHEAGGDVAAVVCDVTDPASVAALADATSERFGAADILVHCAGIYPLATFDEITWEQWRRVMSINLDSLFHLCKAFLPGMKERGWGRVVGMASTTFHGGPPGFSHYTASKGGLIGFIRTLAAEVGDAGITVNAIAPGLVRTANTSSGPQQAMFEYVAAQQSIKRTQVPGDITGALAFLTSDAGAFVTGQTLVVDGGLVRA